MLKQIQPVALGLNKIQTGMIQKLRIPPVAETPVCKNRPSQPPCINILLCFQTGNAVALIKINGIEQLFSSALAVSSLASSSR